MALKSETLQTPQISVVGSSNNISDEKLSGEDLEDGEIFDDEDETPESNPPTDESNKQSNTDKTNNVTSKSSESSKENKSPDSKAASTKTTVNNSKNEQHYLPPWKNNNNNNINTVTSADKKSNSTNNENVTSEKRSREKKKKKKRQRDEDNEDDEKRHKEKRVKKHHDKDVADSLSNKTLPLADEHGNEGNDDEDDEDDDEMLFVRGASPTMNHHPHPKRHNRHPSREEEENDDHTFDEDDDYIDDDEDIDDDFDDEEGDERRRGNRLNDPLARLDRAARRERLSARGKRRGRGGTTGTSKRRKDDGDVCIFYMQGKCHKSVVDKKRSIDKESSKELLGNDCPFSHDAMPHRKLELCKFYLMDCCTKKDKCLYMHSEFPCKYFHMGLKCYANKNCKFSHGKLTDTMRQVFVKTFGPINRSKEFPNKKGAPSKHNRPQDGSGAGNEFPRGRAEGNRRGGPGGGGGPDNKRGDQNQKKIPSLFDIKVSIPDEMLNNHSDSDGGNHTPMPSPPVMHNNVSDSSRSPPPQSHMLSGNMSPSMAAAAARKRRKERKMDRPGRKGANIRGDRNNDDNMGLGGNIRGRQSMMMGNNESSWDEMMDEYQNMARFANASAGGGNSDNTNENNLMNIVNNMNINNFNNSDDLNMDFTSDYNQFDNNSSFNIVSNTDNSNSNPRPNNINNNNNSNKFDSNIANDNSNHSSMEDDRGEGGLQIVENNDEFFPAHLPKKQRELFLRIRQQQRHHASDESSYKQEDGEEDTNETHTDRVSCDSTTLKTENGEDNQGAGGNLTDIFNSKSSNKHHDDQNWYSSDEEDDQPAAAPALGSNNSITALLQNLVRLNSSSSNNTSTSTTTVSHSNSNNFSNVQSTSSTVGSSVSDLSAAGISNVDFDVNVVSELLSKVKQCIQTNTTTSTTAPTEKKTVRDPRLRSDVGPSGDSPGSSSTSLPTVVSPANILNQNHISSAGNNDPDLRLNNSSGTRGVGAGDMDLRNLPFKPAPVHSAANEIDASINSHVPLPYKLIPVYVAKPDYSTVQANSKVGAADPRLRKSLRVSEEPSSVVSSRDPRHRLIEDVSKPKPSPVAPLPQISDPRQRARMAAALSSSNMNDEQQQMSAASLMMSHLQSSYPMLPTGGPPDMGMMCPPTPRIDDDGSPPYMTQIPQMPPVPVSRPTDPRQRHSQMNQQQSSAQPNPMFDPLMNTRQPPNYLAQNNDPRSRPPGMGQPNLSNVFPGSLRSNNPNMNNGPYNYK